MRITTNKFRCILSRLARSIAKNGRFCTLRCGYELKIPHCELFPGCSATHNAPMDIPDPEPD